jgi:hypothetical protein
MSLLSNRRDLGSAAGAWLPIPPSRRTNDCRGLGNLLIQLMRGVDLRGSCGPRLFLGHRDFWKHRATMPVAFSISDRSILFLLLLGTPALTPLRGFDRTTSHVSLLSDVGCQRIFPFPTLTRRYLYTVKIIVQILTVYGQDKVPRRSNAPSDPNGGIARDRVHHRAPLHVEHEVLRRT